jgi:hypothetical protein
MSDIKKYEFSDGSLFTLTGSNYIGYFNITDNVAYAGKYTQDVALANKSNVKTAVTISDKFFNRLINQNISLSYSLSDFVFYPGELLNKNSINVKLEYAFENFIDVYRACFMASSNLPYSFQNFAALSSTSGGLSIVWANSATSFAAGFSALSALYPQIQSSSRICYAPNKYSTNKTLIVANSASLHVFKVNQSQNTFTFVFSSAFVATNNSLDYNQLTFKNITSIARDGNSFYVCDAGNAIVYAYDISDVLAEDRALGKQFNLKNSINHNALLIQPTIVEASENYVFVYDSSSNLVYFYDANFNHINTYRNSKFFSKHPVVDLTYYKPYNQLFALTQDFNIAKINLDTSSTIVALNTAYTVSGELAKKIIFSNSNSDVFYLMTNSSLYKKFVSNPEPNIGSFFFNYKYDTDQTAVYWDTYSVNWSAANINWDYGPKSASFSSASAVNIYDIDTFNSDLSSDDIMLYAFNSFLNYNEITVFNSILK